MPVGEGRRRKFDWFVGEAKEELEDVTCRSYRLSLLLLFLPSFLSLSSFTSRLSVDLVY